MGSVQARLGDFEDVLLYSEVEPRGLATAAVESLSGYVVRVANAYAVPAGVLFARALDAVSSRVDLRARQPRRDLVTGSAETEARAVQAMAALTGRDGLERLSAAGLTRLLYLTDRWFLHARRRWCPECWCADGDDPYERKLWWLALVEVCPMHRSVLCTRCVACGREQPTLTRGVRLHVCSYCGHSLCDGVHSFPLPHSPTADRALWYAQEASRLVHCAEVVSLLGTDQASSIASAYERLEVLALDRGLPGIAEDFKALRKRQRRSKVWHEELFSALWRLDVSVLELLSPPVREAVLVAERSSVDGVSC